MTRPAVRCTGFRTAVAAACGLLLLCPAGALAGDATGLRVGARVRITTRATDPGIVVLDPSGPESAASDTRSRPPTPQTIIGDLTAIGPSFFVVRASGERSVIPLDAISWIEMRERGMSRRRGALTGAGVGLAAAFAVAIIFDEIGPAHCAPSGPWVDRCGADSTRTHFGLRSALLFVPAGSGLGALLAPGERWVAVHPSTPETGGTPGRGGIRVSFTVRF